MSNNLLISTDIRRRNGQPDVFIVTEVVYCERKIMTTSQPAAQFVLPETRALAALGLFDLLATVYLIATHKAQEANPLFTYIFTSFGPTGFVVFKALMLAIPLIIAEKARARSPIFVRRALQIGLVAYVLLLLFAYRQNILHLFTGLSSHTR